LDGDDSGLLAGNPTGAAPTAEEQAARAADLRLTAVLRVAFSSGAREAAAA